MSDKLTKGPAPREGYRPRKGGDAMVPERATPRYTGPVRGQYPKGTVPTPEGTRGGPSGSYQDASTKARGKTSPVVTREGKGHGTPVGSTKSPWSVPAGKSKL